MKTSTKETRRKAEKAKALEKLLHFLLWKKKNQYDEFDEYNK